jgi:hypothetical protein
MNDTINLWRFAIGRALIHAGLRAMPEGRCRNEITAILMHWSVGVRHEIAKSKGLVAAPEFCGWQTEDAPQKHWCPRFYDCYTEDRLCARRHGGTAPPFNQTEEPA